MVIIGRAKVVEKAYLEITDGARRSGEPEAVRGETPWIVPMIYFITPTCLRWNRDTLRWPWAIVVSSEIYARLHTCREKESLCHDPPSTEPEGQWFGGSWSDSQEEA